MPSITFIELLYLSKYIITPIDLKFKKFTSL